MLHLLSGSYTRLFLVIQIVSWPKRPSELLEGGVGALGEVRLTFGFYFV